MRILANVDTLSPIGGVELSTLQVCRELAARGHQVDLLYARDGGLAAQWSAFAASMRQVPGFTVEFARPWPGLRTLPAAVWATRAADPDVIYVNRAEQVLWAGAAALATGAPVVCHLRHHPFTRPAVRALARVPKAYIAVSEFVRREWTDVGVPADRIEVVHNGVDPADYPPSDHQGRKAARRALGLPERSTVFLHYGRLTEEKGTCLLLDAWQAASTPRDWLLLMVGDADAQVSMKSAGLPGVRVLPRRDSVVELLAAADVSVLPALWEEPFGRVVIESMASGLPVIASRRGGIPEILTGPWEQLLFESASVEGLADLIRSVGDWRSGEPDLGERARLHVVSMFNLSRTVDGIESVLRRAERGPMQYDREPGCGEYLNQPNAIDGMLGANTAK